MARLSRLGVAERHFSHKYKFMWEHLTFTGSMECFGGMGVQKGKALLNFQCCRMYV
jgi:hypothetical protein